MPLITCRKCGKRISDTSPRCIHCGEQTREGGSRTAAERIPTSSAKDEQKKKLPRFDGLSEEKQTRLELEFLRSDKAAMKYRRKGEEAKKFASYLFWLFVICRLLLFLQELWIEHLFGGAIYDEQMIEYSMMLVAVLVFVWLASLVFWLYSLIIYRSKPRKLLYHKRLETWLREKKGIQYVPSLITEHDKRLYDQIDANKMNF